jgi:tetratricopeptide (TPR) repeat protein
LEIARERGDRTWERMMLSELIQCQIFLGRWDDPAVALLPQTLVGEHDAVSNFLLADAAQVAAARGDRGLLARCAEIAGPRRVLEDFEFRAMALLTLAYEARDQGRLDEAIEMVKPMLDASKLSGELRTASYALATDAALTTGDEAAQRDLLASLNRLSPVAATPVRLAQRARLLGEQAYLSGDRDGAAALEREAVELLRSVGARELLARALLDSHRRAGDAGAMAEARAIYKELGAAQWLDRLGAVSEVVA